MRRLRRTPDVRRLVAETRLDVSDFIYPLFVCPGSGVREEISAMPGNYHLSVDEVVKEAVEVYELGVPAIILFGIPEYKDAEGSSGWQAQGPVQRAIKVIKKEVPDLVVMTDVCLCDYTDHGHCGLIQGQEILNDPSLENLAKIALSHAEAGADFVCPSDMMDGRVGAIRRKLDEHSFTNVGIMAYSVKYASAMYGPFREAAQSAPSFGDRRSYQMDPANVREAIRETEQDLAEGADIVMVKPALAYLDVVKLIKEEFPVPVAAYNISGEYSMVKAAAAKGWIDERAVALEMLLSMRRAGADMILTYWAKDVARWLKEEQR
ncbi:MAG: porphobilinogen synthase [Firmicutes bacterium]|nr:porphobilinogen synthase [Bacillota bacterium]